MCSSASGWARATSSPDSRSVAICPAFDLSGEEFRALARSMSYDGMMQSLKQSFDGLPLVVIDSGFAATRVLATPKSVEIAFPPGAPSMRQRSEQALGLLHRRRLQRGMLREEPGQPDGRRALG